MEQINRVVSSAIFAMLAASAFSQTPAKLSFEVASIKPNMSAPAGVFVDATKARFLATNASTILLLRYAFEPNLPEDALRRGAILFSNTSGLQIIGGPGWIRTDHFDVEAKPPGDPASQAEMQMMVQSLLEDRFQLKTHREMREVPTYDLVPFQGKGTLG